MAWAQVADSTGTLLSQASATSERHRVDSARRKTARTKRQAKASHTAGAIDVNVEAGSSGGRLPRTARRGQGTLKGKKPQERRPIAAVSPIPSRMRDDVVAGQTIGRVSL